MFIVSVVYNILAIVLHFNYTVIIISKKQLIIYFICHGFACIKVVMYLHFRAASCPHFVCLDD